MSGTDNADQAVGPTTDDKRVRRDAAAREPAPSPEELQRLVKLHLGGRPERGRSSPWLLRLVSAVLAVLALLLLFALLPELAGSAR